jgi:serine phosphatase RsbU (regulator of sigma subunit)/anti-sigma regulatory factor (Ser/Thr protein kinase)
VAGPGTTVGRQARVVGYVGALAAAAVALTLALSGQQPPGEPVALALPVLVLLVAAAERAQVRYRLGQDIDGINLLEAALAPLLFAFPPVHAVLAVAVGQTLAAVLARNAPLKSCFNIAQWSLATACGSGVVTVLAGSGLGPRSLVGLLAGLLVVALVNNLAFAGVLAVSSGGAVLRRLTELLLPAWAAGFALNAAVGVLYVTAYDGAPASVLLFGAPLVVLHLAYRGQAAAHAERALVDGLHRSGTVLTAPLDPRDAIAPWLREVAGTFGAGAVELALTGDTGPEVHRYDGAWSIRRRVDDAVGLPGALGDVTEPARLTDRDTPAVAAAGARAALVAPLLDDDRPVGVLVVLDPSGLEDARTTELPVLAALAREATAAFGKGALLADVLEERRKLAELVSSSSDGILSLDRDGVVRSWNPALARLTGLAEDAVVGRPHGLAPLDLRRGDGRPLHLDAWADSDDLPSELVVDTPTGERRVSCSFSLAEHSQTLVVVARDVTPAREFAALRTQFARLVEAEASQRLVLEHLQEAVMPPLPALAGTELGVRYVASDPSEPTGGDLYDCQVLPDGSVHLAVVDVLGHGVQATQHALSVAHTLRTVVLEGTALEDVVRRADELLARQDPELVATVVLGRYEPTTGRLRLAGGGHPPALVVQADGRVRQVQPEGGAIGWPLAGSRGVVETTLDHGDALVLYTDGLVEARKDIVEGIEALATLAGSLGALPAAAFAAALVDDTLVGADRRDDTLALVVRRIPHDGTQSARWEMEPGLEHAGAGRRALTGWLGAQGRSHEDAALVAGELLANAHVRASASVVLAARLTGGTLHLEVRDDGAGFDAATPDARADDERGRGLAIVAALAHDVRVRSSPAGSSVSAVLDLGSKPPLPLPPQQRREAVLSGHRHGAAR